MKIWPGRPFPLGATWDGRGVNFALFSENATAVELCLFDEADPHIEVARIRLPERTAFVWHGYLADVKPGALYGFRVSGPWEPENGHRFNPAKLLMDPYARALSGNINWQAPVFSYPMSEAEDPDIDLQIDDRDDAWGKPLSVVVDEAFDWGDDRHPNVPWHRSVIYEVHTKGFTMRHPDVPKKLRGTYAGLATPAAIEHFKSLGVTAVELLPIHAFIDEGTLLGRKLTNYWGYNSIGYFAPDGRYSASNEPGAIVREVKQMVKTLHAAGHRGHPRCGVQPHRRGQPSRPDLQLRGIDNACVLSARRGSAALLHGLHRLRQQPERPPPAGLAAHHGQPALLGPRRCTSTASASTWPRHWRVSFTRSIGCRRFFDIIHQDPVLSRVKLIAEPWDVGEGGYQVGNFPVLWTEWNGKYRDALRSFWKGDEVRAGELAFRPGRLSRPVRERRAAAIRQHQLRHRARWLHPRRSGLLQRQAQRGQRRGEPRR